MSKGSHNRQRALAKDQQTMLNEKLVQLRFKETQKLSMTTQKTGSFRNNTHTHTQPHTDTYSIQHISHFKAATNHKISDQARQQTVKEQSKQNSISVIKSLQTFLVIVEYLHSERANIYSHSLLSHATSIINTLFII
ncbi:hypothetical protein GQX74_006036 [Glossina fuscipes]|nr:hypothetical protein GQX74_006036 [Glossina fuscipes]